MKLDQVIPKDGNSQRSSHHFSLKMNVCSVKVVAKEHMEEKKNFLNVGQKMLITQSGQLHRENKITGY